MQVVRVDHDTDSRLRGKALMPSSAAVIFHDVVRRVGYAAAVLLDDPLPAHRRGPTTRSSIALARPFGPDQDLARGGVGKLAGEGCRTSTRMGGHDGDSTSREVTAGRRLCQARRLVDTDPARAPLRMMINATTSGCSPPSRRNSSHTTIRRSALNHGNKA
jgi:hypothetical protein